MMHIRHASTLFYYDGPQVFEARDAIGGHYVAVLAPSDGADDRYLVAGVNPERLRQFRSGVLDLRSLLVESDDDVRYLASASNGLDHPLTLERLPASFIDGELLPDFDFVLHDRAADDYVLGEARARNNLILELAVEPPEAAAQHRIRMSTLAEMLLRVQSMIRHASRAVTKEHPAGYRQPDDDMMDVVVPAAAGSFRIVLEAANFPDLFGDSVLGKALQRIDTFFRNTADPLKTLAVARESRGHLAGAYLRLLRRGSKFPGLVRRQCSRESTATDRHVFSEYGRPPQDTRGRAGKPWTLRCVSEAFAFSGRAENRFALFMGGAEIRTYEPSLGAAGGDGTPGGSAFERHRSWTGGSHAGGYVREIQPRKRRLGLAHDQWPTVGESP